MRESDSWFVISGEWPEKMKQLIYSLVIVTFFGRVAVSDTDSVKAMLSNTEMGRQLLGLNTSDSEKRTKAEEVIRNSIRAHAPEHVTDSPQYRADIYAYGAEMIRRDPAVSFEVKRFIADILAEGIVNDNSDYLKQAAVRWLATVLAVTGPDILSDDALGNIQKGFEDPSLLGRDMVLLAYRAKLKGASKRIEAISRMPIKRNGLLDKTVWTALLVRAWDGDEQVLRLLLKNARKEDVIEYEALLFNDISTVHQPQCTEFLVQYLNSDERMPELKPTLPGTPVASYAASALYQMLEGFPEPTLFGFQADEDVKRCREWVKQHKQFKFREKPLTEKQKEMLR